MKQMSSERMEPEKEAAEELIKRLTFAVLPLHGMSIGGLEYHPPSIRLDLEVEEGVYLHVGCYISRKNNMMIFEPLINDKCCWQATLTLL